MYTYPCNYYNPHNYCGGCHVCRPITWIYPPYDPYYAPPPKIVYIPIPYPVPQLPPPKPLEPPKDRKVNKKKSDRW